MFALTSLHRQGTDWRLLVSCYHENVESHRMAQIAACLPRGRQLLPRSIEKTSIESSIALDHPGGRHQRMSQKRCRATKPHMSWTVGRMSISKKTLLTSSRAEINTKLAS